MEKRGSTFTAISHASVQRALDLNNRHAMELSLLTLDGFEKLIARANYAKWCPGETGFLIALDERADYPNPNFEWFRARFAQFVYIDRVVVDEAHRGQGLARRLYEDLFKTIDRSLVVCEVNLVPPNPASDAFSMRAWDSRPSGRHCWRTGRRPSAISENTSTLAKRGPTRSRSGR